MKYASRERVGWILAVLAIYTVIAALMFGYHYLNDVANGITSTWERRLIEETTGVYTVCLLIPWIVWVARRRPPQRRWWVTVAAWFGGAVVFTIAHTSLMAISRVAIFHVLGLGAYDYGIMLYRYPMEASNDVLSFVTIAAIVTFLDRLRAARAAELHAAELQTKLAQAKLENLRLQLHPHFLFNTLNAISTVMYEDVRKADAMLAKLSDFMRMVLASSDVQQVSIDEEVAIERMYVDIMTARLERSLTLSICIEDGAGDASVPFMLLQPLLENSIRHGMSGTRTSLDLSINVRRANGSTVIRVCDDGQGVNPGAARGIGLNNVESRLTYMYGKQASIALEPRETGGTQATIVFPYSQAANA